MEYRQLSPETVPGFLKDIPSVQQIFSNLDDLEENQKEEKDCIHNLSRIKGIRICSRLEEVAKRVDCGLDRVRVAPAHEEQTRNPAL